MIRILNNILFLLAITIDFEKFQGYNVYCICKNITYKFICTLIHLGLENRLNMRKLYFIDLYDINKKFLSECFVLMEYYLIK
jgi:hypothetical protein